MTLLLVVAVTPSFVGNDEPRGVPRLVSSTSTSTSIAAVDARPALLITSAGITVPVLSGSSTQWVVTTPCGRRAFVKSARVLSGIDVVIDPGHGGREVGAVANGLTEARLNQQVSVELQKILKEKGWNAALTRTGDYRLPIATRAAIVNAARPKLFVSVHHNSGDAARRDGPGTEVYYQRLSPSSKRLAGLVWEDMTREFGAYSARWVGASDAGAIYRQGTTGDDFFGILRRTKGIPGVLTEAAYLSNPSEAALLKQSEFRHAEANGIARAIDRFLNSADAGSGYRTPLVRATTDSGGGGTTNNCTDPKLE